MSSLYYSEVSCFSEYLLLSDLSIVGRCDASLEPLSMAATAFQLERIEDHCRLAAVRFSSIKVLGAGDKP